MGTDIAAKMAIAEEGLFDIREELAKIPTAKTRAIRTKLEAYERVLQGWQHRLPTHEQCNSLLECVMELHDEVFGQKEGGAWSTEKRGSVRPNEEASDSKRPTSPVLNQTIPDEARTTNSPTAPPPTKGKRRR